MDSLYIALALVTGAGIAVQSLINARLRIVLGGPFWAAIGQFVVGLSLLILLAVATRQPAPTFGDVPRAPWWESSRTGDAHCVEFTTDCVEVLLTLRNTISMSPQMKAWRFTPRMMQASSLLPLCTNTGSHISEPKSACVPSRRD